MKHQRKTGGLQKNEDLRNKISNLITKSKEKYYPRNKSKLKTVNYHHRYIRDCITCIQLPSLLYT